MKFLNQALWDVARFQVVKGDFPQENITYNFKSGQGKNNDLFLKKMVNVVALPKLNYLFTDSIRIVPIHPSNISVNIFKC